MFAHGCNFRGQRSARDSSGAVIADACIRDVHRRVIDDHRVGHRAVVYGHVGDVGDVVHRAVIVEAVAIPIAALVADANVSESVVDAPVIANVASPIAIVIAITAAGIAPIPRRP